MRPMAGLLCELTTGGERVLWRFDLALGDVTQPCSCEDRAD